MEVKGVEEAQDENSPLTGSRLALKLASFGIAGSAHYTPRRTNSEIFTALKITTPAPFFAAAPGSLHPEFIFLSYKVHNPKLAFNRVRKVVLSKSEIKRSFSQPPLFTGRPTG
jgi:hypothetical protein